MVNSISNDKPCPLLIYLLISSSENSFISEYTSDCLGKVKNEAFLNC